MCSDYYLFCEIHPSCTINFRCYNNNAIVTQRKLRLVPPLERNAERTFCRFFSVLLNARSEISIEFQLLGHTYVTYFLRIIFWNMALNMLIKG